MRTINYKNKNYKHTLALIVFFKTKYFSIFILYFLVSTVIEVDYCFPETHFSCFQTETLMNNPPKHISVVFPDRNVDE